MVKTTGLGKGLSSLIPNKFDKKIFGKDSQVVGEEERILQLPIKSIKTNPLQPRSDFDYQGLEDLTNSIKEHGIIQPLIVTPFDSGYQLIAGERRLKSAQLLGLNSVPAILRQVKEQEKLELALVENLQRKDLNPIEEAVAYQRLIDEFNLTQDEVAKKIGKNRTVITNTLRLLTLPAEIQKALIAGKINYSTARIIVGVPPQERLKFFHQVLKKDLTVRAVEGAAQKVIVKRHFRKSKDPNLADLEEKLQAALGTKVSIKKSGETGTIVIEFYSEEELQGIIDKISN